MKHILFILVIFFAVGNAQAYTAKGGQSCGVYVDDFDKDGWEKVANAGWLAGVLTGYNIATNSDVGKGMDSQSVVLYVYNYCQRNPLKSTVDAAVELIWNLK
ncbi:hypothetical protein SAMN02745130_03629 [Thiothrix eikelboomii]|uniref:Rap1a immunity protein domain-containing protein n=1 Tax=Thiothrix eikelboomii TaxID=92487 RepID=A0A1T4XXA4_9GAMM|nr:hypothetical protein [Thiothrix eikelboomii]SKA94212.1 hypothetical protein SAMN02745130_03629 [Thiothrix eikelboomii]